MSDEFEVAKQVATHPATGIGGVSLLAWLANKVWRGHRHEVASMKSATVNNSEAIKLLDHKLDAHALLDQELFRDIQKQMSENHKEVLEHLIKLKG